MCGIAGIINIYSEKEIPLNGLRRMTAIMRHRGPDGFGFYRDARAGLGHARLSIIDLEGGGQPLTNETGTLWITFNGEIFNYRELRAELEQQGHVFSTASDTEVILHAFEQHGSECLGRLNGQFAFAIWDKTRQELFAARDRVGIRPFFYTLVEGQLLFASEIKALFTDGRVAREIDPYALDQICTFWFPVPPRTAFCDVFELPAGHHLQAKQGSLKIRRYWEPVLRQAPTAKSEDDYAEELRALLIDATRLQLRADVPVGSYLSGGIDSSAITALVKNHTQTPLRTFSVSFEDADFDESSYQRKMAEHLQADHSSVSCSHADIGSIFSDVVWHTEMPVVRTAPAPLYLLSRLARRSGYKVVLTGEGADEILAGYDIFKEVKVRRFLERGPNSPWRPLILKRLYPYLAVSPVRSLQYARAFFREADERYPPAYASHVPRWKTTSMIKTFYSESYKRFLGDYNCVNELTRYLRPASRCPDALSQAQYIEMKTLLPGYLLSSQGDRMAMANSIESRFPFLDHRVIEFCNALPPALKMRGLTEKYLLKKSMQDMLPAEILSRKKQPYRAPDAKSFLHGEGPDYVRDLLSPANLSATGFFDVNATSLLVKKCMNNALLGMKDNMAIVLIVSTLLIHQLFIKQFTLAKIPSIEGREIHADFAGKA
jgi:asparagine synthase (glutamine-hydrolysing)